MGGAFNQLALAVLWITMSTGVLEGLNTCTAVATELKTVLVPRRKPPHHSNAKIFPCFLGGSLLLWGTLTRIH